MTSSTEMGGQVGRLVGVPVGVAVAVGAKVEWGVFVAMAIVEVDLMEQDLQNMETSVEEMKSSLLPPTSA